MTKITRDGRVLLRRSITSGQVPVEGATTDHTEWTNPPYPNAALMIYPGELFVNLVDNKMWVYTNDGISEIPVFDQLSGLTIGGNLAIGGQFTASGITNSTQGYVLYYNNTTGEVSYANVSGLTPAYISTLSPTLAVPAPGVGGIVPGTTVQSLTGSSFTQMFDRLLFPVVDATLQTANSLGLTGIPTNSLEVGTSYTPPTVTATYVTGTIRNGDGVTTVNLTGNADTFYFKIPGGSTVGTISASSNVQTYSYAAFTIALGANTWSSTVDYLAGTIPYYDNYGGVSHTFDAIRVASSKNANSNTITGYNRAYWGINPNTSLVNADVVPLGNSVLVSGYARSITYAAGSGQYLYYCYPTRFTGTPIFKFGGLPTTFLLQSPDISVTNGSGFTETFHIYRSLGTQTGTSIVIDIT